MDSCIIDIDPYVLRELLGLPAGAVVDAVRPPFDVPGVLALRVRGAGWLVAEGCAIPRALVVVHTLVDADGTRWYRASAQVPQNITPGA